MPVRLSSLLAALALAACGSHAPPRHSVQVRVTAAPHPANCVLQLTYQVEGAAEEAVERATSPWTSDTMSAENGKAVAVSASLGNTTGPASMDCDVDVHCELVVDGRVAVSQQATQHVTCSMLVGSR